ncbi:class I SAM-dependent methyltransferase, partial [Ardenticatena maritima]
HSGARVKVIEADFYQVALPEDGFNAVCYWDGFGIGTDEEQRKLLWRIWSWLRPDGVALIDVYTPWHAAKSSGHGWQVGRARREYGFDGENCRWIDRWWLEETGESVE